MWLRYFSRHISISISMVNNFLKSPKNYIYLVKFEWTGRFGPQLTRFSLLWIPIPQLWAMYAQMGDFPVSMGPPTLPIMQIHVTCFLSSSKICLRQGTSAFAIFFSKKSNVTSRNESSFLQNLPLFWPLWQSSATSYWT